MFMKTFYPRMNKPNIQNDTGISVSEMGLTTLLAQLISILREKLMKIMLYIFEVVTFFFSRSTYLINEHFQW